MNKQQLKMMPSFPDGCWGHRNELKKSQRKKHFGEKAKLSEGLHHSWIAKNFRVLLECERGKCCWLHEHQCLVYLFCIFERD